MAIRSPPPWPPALVHTGGWFSSPFRRPAVSYDEKDLKRIYDSTNGQCHLTGTVLRFNSYNKLELDDGWEVDHSRAQHRGGTHHPNNLRPALIRVNRSKQAKPARVVRAKYGLKGPPPSRAQVERREAAQARWALGLCASMTGATLLALLALVRRKRAQQQSRGEPGQVATTPDFFS